MPIGRAATKSQREDGLLQGDGEVPSAPPRHAWWDVCALGSVLGAAILLPLTYIPGFEGWLPIGQQTVLFVLALLAVASWAMGVLSRGFIVVPKLGRFATGALIMFVLGGVASFIGGPAMRHAFWGSNGTEIDTVMLLVALLLIGGVLAFVDSSPTVVRRTVAVVKGTLLVAFVVAGVHAVAVLVLGASPLGIRGLLTPIGTANTFTVVLGVGFLLFFCPMFSSIARWRMMTHGIGASLMFLGLVVLGHTATLIAIVVALAVFLAMWLSEHGHAVHARLAQLNSILLVAFLAIMFAFAGFRLSGFLRLPAEGLLTQRATWSVAFAELQHGPKELLIGAGPATYEQTFHVYKPLDVNRTVFWNVDFRQGTSWWATILPSFGAIPTLALLVFIVSVFILSFRSVLRAPERRRARLRATFVAAAYLFVVSLLYPASNTLLLLLAVFIGLLIASTTSAGGRVERVALFQSPQRAFFASLVLSGTIVVALFGVFTAGKRIVALAATQRAAVAFGAGDTDRASTIRSIVHAQEQFPTADRAAFLARLWNGALEEQLRGVTKENVETMRPQLQAVLTEAVRAARAATQFEPTHDAYWALLGATYQNVIGVLENADALAIAAYETARHVNPTSPEHPAAIARVHLLLADRDSKGRDEHIDAAMGFLDAAMALKQDYTVAHLLRAQAYERRGELDEAMTGIRKVLQQRPDDIGVLFSLGVLEYKAGERVGAKRTFLRTLELQPNYANAKYFIGRIAQEEGDRAEAIRQFEAILELNPQNEEIQSRLKQLRASVVDNSGQVPGDGDSDQGGGSTSSGE